MSLPSTRVLLGLSVAERSALLRQYCKEQNNKRWAKIADERAIPSAEFKRNWPVRPEDEISAEQFKISLDERLYYERNRNNE